MNKKENKVIKLKRSNKYNTYQFYGEMANKDISLTDGLKYAVLMTFKWLRDRLDNNNIPKELLMPKPDDYKRVNNDEFKSFIYNDNFLIIVETNIDEGIWSLRVIENDTGAINQSEIVPGRTIQSDIAYRIVDDKLECGFSTQVSDVNEVEKAECIRFGLIKELGMNDIFGFKQINNLSDKNNIKLVDEDKVEVFKKLVKSKENQLPFIIYTYDDYAVIDPKELELLITPSYLDALAEIEKSLPEKEKEDISVKIDAYINRYYGQARLYFLPKSMFNKLANFLGYYSLDINEVIVVEPLVFGGKKTRYHYEDKDKYQYHIFNYTRDKNIDFHDVLFVDEAKMLIDQFDEQYIQDHLNQLDGLSIQIEQLKNQLARKIRLNEYNKTEDTNEEELIATLEKYKKSEEEKSVLIKQIDILNRELKKKNEYIDYIKRKEQRPKYHKDIPGWAKMFDSLILHDKAISLLESNSAMDVDLDLICDALDYLGTAYSDYLFNGLSIDELNNISTNIYNRPFDVTPSGIPISARGDCKIKYAFEGEKRVEHVLDQHLRVGVHDGLLRIYFIVDKKRNKIVIGSLPKHLNY